MTLFLSRQCRGLQICNPPHFSLTTEHRFYRFTITIIVVSLSYMVRYLGPWVKVNNEVIRADRTAERTVGRIKKMFFTTRFSVYFLTSCNFKIGVQGANYYTTIVDGRDCVASTVDVSNPAYFKRCLDSTVWLTTTNLVPKYVFEKVYVPVSSAVYLHFVRNYCTCSPWIITSTFREIGPHQLSKIKNATLMDKFMAHLIYPGGWSIHIPYWRKNLIAHLMLGHRPDSFAPTLQTLLVVFFSFNNLQVLLSSVICDHTNNKIVTQHAINTYPS